MALAGNNFCMPHFWRCLVRWPKITRIIIELLLALLCILVFWNSGGCLLVYSKTKPPLPLPPPEYLTHRGCREEKIVDGSWHVTGLAEYAEGHLPQNNIPEEIHKEHPLCGWVRLLALYMPGEKDADKKAAQVCLEWDRAVEASSLAWQKSQLKEHKK